MARGADPKSYQEVINQIRAFENSLNEKCSSLEQAGRTCIDNMDGDPSASKSVENLGRHINEIREQFGTLHSICSALNEEMEAIIAATNRANEG